MNTNENTLNMLYRYAFLVCLVVIMGACASSNVPAPDTSEAESMVRQAEEAGAQEYAPLELRNARKKIEEAKTLVDDEQYAKATRLTEEASVDAELAMVKARSEKAREAVEQLRKTIKTLKDEIERNQQRQGGSL
jgi:Na+-transporting methylmalonyl-CoA/oxaloacetate decarboxylase gamma subunit